MTIHTAGRVAMNNGRMDTTHADGDAHGIRVTITDKDATKGADDTHADSNAVDPTADMIKLVTIRRNTRSGSPPDPAPHGTAE